MPVKTATCAYSEEKIYPGHGMIFIRRDGKRFQLGRHKALALQLANRKALGVRWTKAWRRAHKKEVILRDVKHRGKKKTAKAVRGIEGLSLQELLRKKNESAEQRKKKQATADQKPKQLSKKQDLNERLKELRKKKKLEEEQKKKKAVDQKAKKGDKKGAKGKDAKAKDEKKKKKAGGKKKGKK